MKPDTLLFEIAWEVCNQIGGIYTYVKSKAPAMTDIYGDNYFLVGPYFHEKAKLDFRPIRELDNSPLSRAILYIRSLGYDIHLGYWLLEEARPRVILINPIIPNKALNEVKTALWQHQEISALESNVLLDQVLGFGEVSRLFFTKLIEETDINQDIIAHFHEWMSAAALAELARQQVRIATVFTTHATSLGRYLASNEDQYFCKIPTYNWQQKAREYGIEAQAQLERNAAKYANVLVTNSESTAAECEVFLGRKPDSIVHSGIHRKPGVGYEVFEWHLQNRQKIDAFVKALFSPSYQLRSDKTLYFFTSGRYEFYNKGFDVTLQAIARLNEELVRRKSETNVVLFIISKQPFHNIKPDVLEARQRFQELQRICKMISAKLGPRIYANVTGAEGRKLPDLNQLIDDDLQMTWRQALANFKRKSLPPTTTHHLTGQDDILAFCQQAGLTNNEGDNVKVIYHPDFIERVTSLFSMEYLEFVRGCHLGVFPSLYEPWGYAPMETVLHGTPVVTSDVSGFGHFARQAAEMEGNNEVKVVKRREQSSEQAVIQLTEIFLEFIEDFESHQYIPRATLPKSVLDSLCWSELQKRYEENYKLALLRYQPVAGLY
ncbi:glycosyltransferase [Dyadobacter chenhuakuii]|uniref:Glycosyltransferase n=1 Tax=Dyadobacter chenhuakuii TaxID=2909339 RepID=A0ABY4XP06_9BACT|nr:glycosyltransferase [Dyadobacter chenhuakuii]MCF2494630.1 glycosyltransferase [Dyadobacter chenhuakuii]USJ32048.1 glycosyltransferase [Dyadobacter chenhuakuii]